MTMWISIAWIVIAIMLYCAWFAYDEEYKKRKITNEDIHFMIGTCSVWPMVGVAMAIAFTVVGFYSLMVKVFKSAHKIWGCQR